MPQITFIRSARNGPGGIYEDCKLSGPELSLVEELRDRLSDDINGWIASPTKRAAQTVAAIFGLSENGVPVVPALLPNPETGLGSEIIRCLERFKKAPLGEHLQEDWSFACWANYTTVAMDCVRDLMYEEKYSHTLIVCHRTLINALVYFLFLGQDHTDSLTRILKPCEGFHIDLEKSGLRGVGTPRLITPWH